MSNYIFYDGELLERSGGPSTYLFNLREGVMSINKENFKFISRNAGQEYKKTKFYKDMKTKVLKYFPKTYEKIMINHYLNEGDIYKDIANFDDIELIHFHSTSNYIKAKKYLKEGVITLLMSHSPEITSKQVSKSLSDKYEGKYDFKKIENFYLEKFDKPAFEGADVLVFPSKEAMDPYYETCENFGDIIKNKKIKYLMTGTKPLEFCDSNEEFRNKYNIPKNAFIISFVGRHNEVKGYDNFIRIGERLMQEKKDIYIITAGVGSIESPKNERWIDIGWTKDPGSIINASNIFVLPNKRTYFDLVLLEVLSIGKTCIVSNTGGNKTVSNLTKGVIKYNSIDDAVKKIIDLYSNRNKLLEYEKLNKETYNKYFTVEKFSENYIKMIDEIKAEIR